LSKYYSIYQEHGALRADGEPPAMFVARRYANRDDDAAAP
jgi:hypothetical protein